MTWPERAATLRTLQALRAAIVQAENEIQVGAPVSEFLRLDACLDAAVDAVTTYQARIRG